MEITLHQVAERPNARWRFVVRLAVAMFLTIVGVVLLQSSAFASSGLSSVILTNSEPGLVAVPLGAYNGPITQSSVAKVMGSIDGPTSWLGQSLAAGTVTAYVRSWVHQPTNGDIVIIVGFQFTNGSDESSFVNGLNDAMRSQSGSEPLAVAGIPDASGSAVHTSTSGTPQSNYVVTFAKGNTVFQLVVSSSLGDLTSADALSLANQQFANAPNVPAGALGTHTDWWRITPLVGIALCIAIILIARKRKYPLALRGFAPGNGYNWAPPVAAPSGPWGPNPSPPTPLSSDQRPKVSSDQWQ